MLDGKIRLSFFLFSLVALLPPRPLVASAEFPSLCGYPLSEHHPRSVIGRIATASIEANALEAFFPTIATISAVRQSDPAATENHFVQISDGIVRTGAARFTDGTVRALETDLGLERGVSDIDVIGVRMTLRNDQGVVPLSALVDGQGEISLVVDGQTKLAQRLAADRRTAVRNYALSLPSSPQGPFVSVSMVNTDSNQLRIFGLTESSLFACDMDLRNLGPDSDLEWTELKSTSGARFVRGIDRSTYLIAKEDGQVDFYGSTGRTRTERIPGMWLSSLSAYGIPTDSGETEIRFAALSYSGGQSSRPIIHLWEDDMLSQLPLDFPSGEAPVAVAFSGIRITSPELWTEWRRRDIYETGHVSELDPVTHETKRLLLMSRRGNNYLFRGVQGWTRGQVKLSSFPWFYVGPNYSELQKQMAQAGFSVETLRQRVDFNVDIGERGEKLVTRLQDGYGFEPFDPARAREFRGSPISITAAWRRRLGAMRDLRLARARVAQSIAEEGIVPRRDQMMVYELMNLEEALNRETEADLGEDLVAPSTDEEWIADFRARLTDQASPLVQESRTALARIRSFYRAQLQNRNWSDTHTLDYDLLPAEMKPLYLISRQYLASPFKHVVEGYIRFAARRREAPYWEVLADYLDSVDPLRAVTDDESLMRFLTTRP